MVTEKSKANLIPNKERSESELREMARKGGVNSGIARREKRSLKDTVKAILDLPLSSEEKKRLSEKLKLKGEITQREAVALSLLEEAKMGKPQQARLILELDDSIGSNVQQVTAAPTLNVIVHSEETKDAMAEIKKRERVKAIESQYGGTCIIVPDEETAQLLANMPDDDSL